MINVADSEALGRDLLDYDAVERTSLAAHLDEQLTERPQALINCSPLGRHSTMPRIGIQTTRTAYVEDLQSMCSTTSRVDEVLFAGSLMRHAVS
jgi:hypothetical protein